MVLIGSLHLSSPLGFCRNKERRNQFKYIAGRNDPLLTSSFSLCSSRQDSWSCRQSFNVDRPLFSVPCKCNVLRCHSFVTMGQNAPLLSIQTATVALTRSFNALQGTPFVNKSILAVSIIIFALWGLNPLMRISRNILLRKNDNSWKKSTVNYVVTSYLQPVLMWTGAILLCRAVDPMAMPTQAGQLVKQRFLNFVKSLSTVLAFACCLSSVIQQAQKYLMETNDPSDARNMGFQFAGKAIYSAIWVAAFSLFMELLGFSTQKWLTAGGLGTVLLTLAGREIFTNFLSSAMIHATRPFVVNERIQTKIEGCEVSGTVEHMGWWSPTIIRGEEREAVYIPNHKFTTNVVRNLSQKTHWRIKTHLAISHLDVSKINSIVSDMRKVLAKNPHVEQQKLHRRVFLDNIDPENQAHRILISCFVKTSRGEEYLCVKEAILLDLLRVISHHRARLATPIRTIHKFSDEPDLDDMSFSRSFFTRGGPASKRQMLLIEPPYKINGKDTSKPQSRGTHTSGDRIRRSEPKTDSNTKEKLKSRKKAEGKDESKAVVGSTMVQKGNDKISPSSEVENNITGITQSEGLEKSENTQQSLNTETSNLSVGSSHSKEVEKSIANETSKSKSATLEENIVLGVALEASKRTLPIEEGLDSLPSSELAVQGSGPMVEKDEKDK